MIQTRGMSPTFDRDPRKSHPRFLAFAIPFGWILDPKKFDVGIDWVAPPFSPDANSFDVRIIHTDYDLINSPSSIQNIFFIASGSSP